MHVLIPAAGSGSRMKAGKNKLLIELEKESLIFWTIKSILSASLVSWVGIIGQPNDKQELLKSIKNFSNKFKLLINASHSLVSAPAIIITNKIVEILFAIIEKETEKS